MQHEMRRTTQHLSKREMEEILHSATCGVLALTDTDGEPYAVPLSFVYTNGACYFHCAQQGHKMDAIAHDARASFCVVGQDLLTPAEYTTYFRSVIAFGKMSKVEEHDELIAAMMAFTEKFVPCDNETTRRERFEMEKVGLCVLKLTIDRMTGKQALALANQAENRA